MSKILAIEAENKYLKEERTSLLTILENQSEEKMEHSGHDKDYLKENISRRPIFKK